jgi:thymidylate synthase
VRTLPQLRIKDRGQDLFGYELEDFEVVGYDPHPHIAAPVAV